MLAGIAEEVVVGLQRSRRAQQRLETPDVRRLEGDDGAAQLGVGDRLAHQPVELLVDDLLDLGEVGVVLQVGETWKTPDSCRDSW